LQHILFQDIEVRLNFRAEIGSKRLGKLIRISRSKLAGYVKSRVIKFGDTNEYLTPVESGHGDAGRRTLVFFQDLAQSLPLCVKALCNLRSLDMGYRSALYGSGSEELLSHEHCQQLDTTMAVILMHADLDHLEKFTIRVPCTYDIHTIVEYDRDHAYSQCGFPLARTMSSLRSLTLKICDSFGLRVNATFTGKQVCSCRLLDHKHNTPKASLTSLACHQTWSRWKLLARLREVSIYSTQAGFKSSGTSL